MNKLTLLVVDDLEMNREILAKVFEEEYHVLLASNGVEAMEIIRSNTVEMIITDIFMEPMNGYEFIHTVRSKDEYKMIPIIAITESDHASRKKALQAGADDLLYRPFVTTILHNRVKGLLFDGFDLNRYKIAYENNPIPFLLYHVIDRPDTPNYKVLYMNQAARSEFSPPFTEFLANTDEAPEQRNLMLEAIHTKEVQHKVIYQSEVDKWIDWTIYPDGSGLIVAMLHDITSEIRKQTASANERVIEVNKEKNALKEIIATVPAGIIVFDISKDDVTIVEANASCCKLLDVDTNLIHGTDKVKMLSFIHEDDRKVVEEALQVCAEPGKHASYKCRVYNHSKKEYIWYSAEANSIEQENGKIYAFTSFSDITADIELSETRVRLESSQKLSEAKSEFLSNMSHDMRTPVNGILGVVEMMQDKVRTQELKEDLTQIRLSGHYLLNLINDFLDLNHITDGDLELKERPAISGEILQNVLQNAEMMAKDKNIQFHTDIPSYSLNSTVPVIADSARVEQILLNVIGNAIKFTPEGGDVGFHMETLSVSNEEIYDQYVIEDHGIGMSEEFLRHIYEPFQQEKRLEDYHQAGAGLGLSVSKHLVDLMGGEMMIESKENVGTKVTLRIRYKTYQGKKNDDHFEKYLQGKHILLCEDHALNAKITMNALEKAGAIVECADNGKIGLQKYEEATDGYYDVILMDVHMPVMDGLEATRAIRHSSKKDAHFVPIIALTANLFDTGEDTCLQAGMNTHLTKPIETKVLYATISKAIQQR